MSHRDISFTKSAIRILGYMFFLINPYLAVAVLILSEVLGIAEEVGQPNEYLTKDTTDNM